jgi:hypothetical protein
MKAIVLAFLLPLIGTKFGVLPEGKGKSVVESRCYACHSSDMLLQQRLDREAVDRRGREDDAVGRGGDR